MMAINTEKNSLRRLARKRRHQGMQNLSERANSNFFKNLYKVLFSYNQVLTISAFLPIGDEFDLHSIMIDLWEAKRRCVLPVVIDKSSPLIFREWRPNAGIVEGPFNTRHPNEDAIEIDPDILLVPLLAFDQNGSRLGWGGGYYDRTIARLRKIKQKLKVIGVGLEVQEVGYVPQNKFDQPLDMIITEREVKHISKNSGLLN